MDRVAARAIEISTLLAATNQLTLFDGLIANLARLLFLLHLSPFTPRLPQTASNGGLRIICIQLVPPNTSRS
jgi:hypothetical protein